MRLSPKARRLLPAMFCLLAGTSLAHAQDAATLQARHAALREQLAVNQFQRPLHLESRQVSNSLQSDVFALVEQPFSVVSPALQGMEHWCDILILHLNVKRCRISVPKSGDTLNLSIGGKHDRPSTDSFLVNFRYQVPASGPDYLRVLLGATKGPFGTSDYHVVLEAAPLGAAQTFLHLSYAYAFGRMARIAMQGYLATRGRNKVGFTIIENNAGGEQVHVRGMRGVVERNTMRYYLALEAYLGALPLPAAEQFEQRLNDWHTAVERYPLQLHELERDEYLALKRAELRRRRVPGQATTRS